MKTPNGLNMNPESDTAKHVVELVRECVQKSLRGQGDKPESWKKMLHLNNAFVDNSKKSKQDRAGKVPGDTNIVVNMAGALEEMFLAYARGVAFGRREYYPIIGKGGRANYIRTALLERVNQTQAVWFNHEMSHITHWRDMHRYGVGAMAPVWTQKERTLVKDIPVDPILAVMLQKMGVDANIGDVYRVPDTKVVKIGSELRNIQVQNLLLDPDTPVKDYQSARYCGYFYETDAYDLIRRSKNPKEGIFNAELVLDNCKQATGFGMGWEGRADTGRGDRDNIPSGGFDFSSGTKLQNSKTTIAVIFITLIPSKEGLGDKTDPEKWMLAVADNKIPVQCERLNLDHEMYPLIVGAPTTDGYDVWPTSNMEKAYPLYQFADWMLRITERAQHKTMNGKIIMDPSVLNFQDVKENKQIIRAEKGALLGDKRLADYITQLEFNNPTQGNLAVIDSITNMITRVSGMSDLISQLPDRPTQQGVAYAQNKDMARMQFTMRMIFSQCWPSLTEMICHNTIQFLDKELAYRILGSRYEMELVEEFGTADELVIGKFDLDSNFEYLPLDPTLADQKAAAMATFLERAMSIPQVAMTMFAPYNIGGIMEEVVRDSGFENISDFKNAGGNINFNAVSPEQIEAGVQSGQYSPAPGAATQ